MTSFFDKLNLKPGERRFVVIVAIAVFILLNAFFVWPKFGERGRLQQRRAKAEQNLKTFQDEVDKTKRYQLRLAELQKAGASVASEDQALNLVKTVSSQAALSGLQITRYDPTRGTGIRTNQFFDEQSGTINFVAEEKALVDFLFNLGQGGSLIRVRSMTLNPDVPARQKLGGNIQVVASYARRAPVRTVPGASPSAAARTNAPAATAGPRPATVAAAATNAPVKQSIGARIASWFGSKPASAPAPAATTAKTNAPPKK